MSILLLAVIVGAVVANPVADHTGDESGAWRHLLRNRRRTECMDKDTECPVWHLQGECEANRNWMTSNCQYSCNTCPSGTFRPREPCTDDHTRCGVWAHQGECQGNNRIWMLLTCKVSCGNCQD